jgi:hypothetical protein
VSLVVLGVQQLSRVSPEAGTNFALGVEALPHPQWSGMAEGAQSPRGDFEISLDEPLELQQRLFVEDDGVELRCRDASLGKAVPGRLTRKSFLSLHAGKTLFLGRRHDPFAGEQARRAVVIEGGYAEYVAARHR